MTNEPTLKAGIIEITFSLSSYAIFFLLLVFLLYFLQGDM